MQATIPLGEARLEYPFLTTDTGSQSYGAYAVPKTIPALIVQSLVDESGFLSAGPTIIRSTSGEAMQVPYLSTAPDATAFKTEGAAATETTVSSARSISPPAISPATSPRQQNSWPTALPTPSARSSRCARRPSARPRHPTRHRQRCRLRRVHDRRSRARQQFADDVQRRGFARFARLARPELQGPARPVGVLDAAYTIALKMLNGEGNSLIQPAATAEGFDVLWGSPVFVDSYGPALATGNHVVLYGRPDAYWLRMVNGVEVTRSDEFAFTSWKSTFRFGLRTGGAIVDTAGLKALALAWSWPTTTTPSWPCARAEASW